MNVYCGLVFLLAISDGHNQISSSLDDSHKTENPRTSLRPFFIEKISVMPSAFKDLESCKFVLVNGFIKQRCLVNYSGGWMFKCPFSDNFYQVTSKQCNLSYYTDSCPDDPSFYQYCGHSLCDSYDFRHQDGVGVCGEIICKMNNHSSLSIMNNPESRRCNGIEQCLNRINGTAVDERQCPHSDNVPCGPCPRAEININSVSVSLFCNGVCNCPNCFDEAKCDSVDGNVNIGIICKVRFDSYLFASDCANAGHSFEYVQPHDLCDGIVDCVNGADERGCNPADTCEPGLWLNFDNYHDSVNRKLHPMSKCSNPHNVQPTYRVCRGYEDQINCTNKERPLLCNVGGYPTTMSVYVTCRDLGLCDDNIDSICMTFSKECTVHKHRICDGIEGCTGQADERFSKCESMTSSHVVCVRKFSNNLVEGPFPTDWVMDGVEDCRDGLDEDPETWFKMCGMGEKTKFSFKRQVSCNESTMFKCPRSDNFLDASSLCSDLSNCDKILCKISRWNYRSSSAVKTLRFIKRAFHCLPGINDLERVIGICEAVELKKESAIYGVEDAEYVIFSPTYARKVSCLAVHGELYVYLACSGFCNENVKCPLTPLNHNSCFTRPNRAITITDERKLTVVFRQRDSSFVQDLFCLNGLCIPYHKVCDLNDDCGDLTDEENCANNFKCLSSGEYIAKSKKCDGDFDCLDNSDECNEHCDNQVKIFSTDIMFLMALVFGILATILNVTVIWKGLMKYSSLKTATAQINEAFVLVVSSGDLLQGIFVLFVALSDEFLNESTCETQFSWVTSKMCVALGILSTIGSLVSLYSMTCVSVFRAHGLRAIHVRRDSIQFWEKIKLFCCIAGIYLVACMVAFLPTIKYLESYFVRLVTYDSNPLFVGALDKNRHIRITEEYFDRLLIDDPSWDFIGSLVQEMFVGGEVRGRKIGFYGSNGFCLFNYFTSTDDPQFWLSASVLISNIVCVIIITMCYVYITVATAKSSALMGQNNKVALKRNRKIQRKVSILITTDIISWVPFFVIWVVHIAQLFSTSSWYSVFSIIILPANSIVNPVLILEDGIKGIFDKVIEKISGCCKKEGMVIGQPAVINGKVAGPMKSETSNVSAR